MYKMFSSIISNLFFIMSLVYLGVSANQYPQYPELYPQPMENHLLYQQPVASVYKQSCGSGIGDGSWLLYLIIFGFAVVGVVASIWCCCQSGCVNGPVGAGWGWNPGHYCGHKRRRECKKC